MALVTATDPFGFVGSHVIRRARTGSSNTRTNSNRNSVALEFAACADVAVSSNSAPATSHGWITRYDARLDAYTLFIPDRGASVHSRTDMLKLIADANFDVQHDTNEADAPTVPTRDTSSRYVGVRVTKHALDSTRDSNASDANVGGVVECYVPFADTFRVAFDDDTTQDVTEQALINAMICMLKTPVAAVGSSASRKRKRDALPLPAATLTPPATIRSVSAPLPSIVLAPPPPVSMMPVSYAAVLGMDSSPIVTPSNILELATARNSNSTNAIDAAPVGARQFIKTEPRAAFATSSSTVRFTNNSSTNRSSSTNIISLLDDDDSTLADADDAMAPVAMDDAMVDTKPTFVIDDVVMLPVASVASGNNEDPWTPHDAALSSSSAPPRPPFYLAADGRTTNNAASIAPLESRSLAYKYVREALLELLDRRDASAKKLAIQYDILRNTDIKPLSSIKRFTEASGLVVLNHLLTTYLETHEDDSTRAADVLLLLKLIAMLPIPARKHVADSKIALTVGLLTKPKARETYRQLPICLFHLAKWIKRKWTEHFRKLEDHQHRATTTHETTTDTSRTGHPSHRLGTRSSSSEPTSTTSSRLVDTTLIPRLANRPTLTDASATATTSSKSTTATKSSLKPDWLQRQENLRRTRFSSEHSSQDSAAEYAHYKRGRQLASSTPAAAAAVSVQSRNDALSRTMMQQHDSEQPASAGGVRGTYGRQQKLAFQSRWSVAEFYRDAPPSAVRAAATNAANTANRSTVSYRASSNRRPPRSILRRVSKYQSNLDSFS